MAGFIGSLKDSLRTLIGLQKPVSATSQAETVQLPSPQPMSETLSSLPSATQQASNESIVEVTTMSTTANPVAVATTVKQPNGFVRFIDAIGSFFVKAEPTAEKLAVAVEPLLALSPVGPEYDLVVNAIVGARKTAAASLAAGTALTGTQQMSLVLQASAPALTTILESKGITEPNDVQTAIGDFAQNVYNLQTGPVAVTTPTPAKTA